MDILEKPVLKGRPFVSILEQTNSLRHSLRKNYLGRPWGCLANPWGRVWAPPRKALGIPWETSSESLPKAFCSLLEHSLKLIGAFRRLSWNLLGLPGANLGPTWGQLGPTWAHMGQHGPTWGQLGANLGPTWGQLRANLGQNGPTWGQLGPTWGSLGANLGQLGANLSQHGSRRANVSQLGANLERTWTRKSLKNYCFS